MTGQTYNSTSVGGGARVAGIREAGDVGPAQSSRPAALLRPRHTQISQAARRSHNVFISKFLFVVFSDRPLSSSLIFVLVILQYTASMLYKMEMIIILTPKNLSPSRTIFPLTFKNTYIYKLIAYFIRNITNNLHLRFKTILCITSLANICYYTK